MAWCMVIEGFSRQLHYNRLMLVRPWQSIPQLLHRLPELVIFAKPCICFHGPDQFFSSTTSIEVLDFQYDKSDCRRISPEQSNSCDSVVLKYTASTTMCATPLARNTPKRAPHSPHPLVRVSAVSFKKLRPHSSKVVMPAFGCPRCSKPACVTELVRTSITS